MNTEIIVHAAEFANETDFIRQEVNNALTGKLDAYIKKNTTDAEKIRVELTLERDKKGITGKLEISSPTFSYRSSRENFEKLEDLIHHLFSHIKEQMAK